MVAPLTVAVFGVSGSGRTGRPSRRRPCTRCRGRRSDGAAAHLVTMQPSWVQVAPKALKLTRGRLGDDHLLVGVDRAAADRDVGRLGSRRASAGGRSDRGWRRRSHSGSGRRGRSRRRRRGGVSPDRRRPPAARLQRNDRRLARALVVPFRRSPHTDTGPSDGSPAQRRRHSPGRMASEPSRGAVRQRSTVEREATRGDIGAAADDAGAVAPPSRGSRGRPRTAVGGANARCRTRRGGGLRGGVGRRRCRVEASGPAAWSATWPRRSASPPWCRSPSPATAPWRREPLGRRDRWSPPWWPWRRCRSAGASSWSRYRGPPP